LLEMAALREDVLSIRKPWIQKRRPKPNSVAILTISHCCSYGISPDLGPDQCFRGHSTSPSMSASPPVINQESSFLHTFTHHTDSIRSLFSTHPSLEIFYSGDRSSLVCQVGVEGYVDDGDGKCIVLCQHQNLDLSHRHPETQVPVVIVVVGCVYTEAIVIRLGENQLLQKVRIRLLLWTISYFGLRAGTSSVRRWRIPHRRSTRVVPRIFCDGDEERIPFDGFSDDAETTQDEVTFPAVLKHPEDRQV